MNRPTHSTVLAFDKVCLSYPQSRSIFGKERVTILDNVSFTIQSGRTIGVLGRNGAGKSSLLRLMAGVLQQDSGRIIRPQPNLKISLLTTKLGFQSHLTGRENALLGCLLMGLSRTQADAVLPEIISFSGLTAHIDDTVSTYSSGMRARLGFSVAYYTRSDIMLIDEALGVGDHEFKLKSRDAMLEAIASDRTAVLVSHDEAFLKEQCEELLWLENGMLVMQGEPVEVLDRYHDYNHVIMQLAVDMGIEVEAVRAHPDSRDPIAMTDRLQTNLRRSRAREQAKSGEGVHYYYPSRREQLSQLCLQECGSTVWVERARCIASGEDHDVRELYQGYEELKYKMAKAAKINKHELAHSGMIATLVALLDELSTHSSAKVAHD